MVSSNLGEVRFEGKDYVIKTDVCCLIHSYVSHFGLFDFHRILEVVGDKLGVDIFEK